MIQNTPTARLIACSKHPEHDIILRTFELEYWRPIHGEVMTHRVFSRNAGSSRAKPSGPINAQVASKPWGPSHWGKNGKGMQAHGDHDEPVTVPSILQPTFGPFVSHFYPDADVDDVSPEIFWHFTAWLAGRCAQAFGDAGYHKQVTNRITEPFTSIKVVLTTTDMVNFYGLRDHHLAQPEIQELARAMRAAESVFPPRLLQYGEWHLPYADREEDRKDAEQYLTALHNRAPTRVEVLQLLLKMSAARCARVSYNLFDGSKSDIASDLRLFEDLLVDQPIHASPAEHQATPLPQLSLFAKAGKPATGEDPLGESEKEFRFFGMPDCWSNLHGFLQHRKVLPNENLETRLTL